MMASYISLIVLFFIAIGTMISIFEGMYRQNLLNEVSFKRFKKLKVVKLELKRFEKNTYLGSNLRLSPSNSKRKEIPLNSGSQDKIGMYNTIENELTVFAVCKRMKHEVFTCSYSEENLKKLLSIVENYNMSA